MQYAALQSIVASFLEQGSAGAASSSDDAPLSKEKEAAVSRLADADNDDSLALAPPEAPAKKVRAPKAPKAPNAAKSSKSSKRARPVPKPADDEEAEAEVVTEAIAQDEGSR